MITRFRSDKKYKIADLSAVVKSQLTKLPQMISPVGTPLSVIRYEYPCEKIHLLNWLGAQTNARKMYWSNLDSAVQIAGIGVCQEIKGTGPADYKNLFNSIEDCLSEDNPNLRFYGGLAFDDQNASVEWQDFGTYRFFIPQFEFFQSHHDLHFAINIALKDINEDFIKTLLADFEHLQFSSSFNHSTSIDIKERRDIPDEKTWKNIFDKVQSDIGKDEYQKIVLARQSNFTFKEPLNAVELLNALQEQTPQCFHFCFQLDESTAFLGASPERLYKRSLKNIETVALAGTKPRGENIKEDQIEENKLLNSAKDKLEHQYVVEAIQNVCDDLCETFKFDPKFNLLKLKGGHHLITKFFGTLKKDITDCEILSKLHPTPAVAGFPVKTAVKTIRALEKFNRGWYAGPVGYIGFDETEFAVGIRSGLLQDNQLRIFAGAGIVSQSKSQDEWNEIENKIGSFIRIFNHESSFKA